jgi:threonine/homoserine/homoserine lactone efflux protein
MVVTLSHLVVSWMVGFISGLLVSIPVGPVNITILNEGARRGFRWALLIGLGATSMEVTYCVIGFAGFSGLFNSTFMRAVMELSSFVLMFVLGVKYLFIRSLPAMTKTVEKVEHRLHPHTGFMIGYLRVMANPGVLLGWITISASFIAHEWVAPVWSSKLVCISGVGLGALIWFIFFSYVAARGHGRLSYQTLLRMSRASGGTLLIMAGIIGARIIRLLAEAH